MLRLHWLMLFTNSIMNAIFLLFVNSYSQLYSILYICVCLYIQYTILYNIYILFASSRQEQLANSFNQCKCKCNIKAYLLMNIIHEYYLQMSILSVNRISQLYIFIVTLFIVRKNVHINGKYLCQEIDYEIILSISSRIVDFFHLFTGYLYISHFQQLFFIY